MDRLLLRAPRRALVGHALFRRAAVAVALGGLLLGVVPAAAEDLEGRKDKVEREIDRADQHVRESSKALEAATQRLVKAEAELSAARGYLARTRGELAAAVALEREMQSRLASAIERLTLAQEELGDGQQKVDEQEDQIRAMVVSAYESGDPALMGLSMVFDSQDPTQLAGQLSYNSDVVNVEAALLDQLKASKVMLVVKEEETEAAKVEIAERRREAVKNLARKQALETQAEEAAQQVGDLVGLRERARRSAVEAKNADLAQLAKLEAEQERIERLIAERASSTSFKGFVDGSGLLTIPTNGWVSSPFGWRTHPITGQRAFHDGVDLAAGCGTPVLAPASGVVLSAYYSDVWGNRVILDHGVQKGVGLTTIANHMERSVVAPNQRVSRGQVIGYVGSTGWSTGCHLHWTLNQNGTPVDPMGWL